MADIAVPFKQIPQQIRVPLFYAEVDNSQANTASQIQRTLIIGQITSLGAATPNVPIILASGSDAITQGGPGSMLALKAAKYRAGDTFGEVWLLPLADDPSGTAATSTVTFTAQATANGSLNLYIGEVRVVQAVVTTQTVNQLATALAALINADTSLPVTAGASSAVVTLTAKNKGPQGNAIPLQLNYLGARGGEATATGLGVAIVAMSGGATAPSLTAALANCSDRPFDFIDTPYNDTTSLDALKAFLNDTTGRWAWSKGIFGHYFGAYGGSLGASQTFGSLRNDQHGTVLAVYQSPTPVWLWASALTATAAISSRADPALPMQTAPILGVLPPPLQYRFTLTERNTLLYTGMSTYIVGDDGSVFAENIVTTYQKNPFGDPDDSYLEVETMFTLAYVLRFLRNVVTSKFARVKLADNATRVAGPGVVTPNIIRVELIAAYRELEARGVVQKGDQFKKELVVVKSTINPNRVDVLWPGTLINQLRIFALLAQFRLQ